MASLFLFAALALPGQVMKSNRAVIFEGSVRAGQSYTHAVTPQWDFKLEAVPSGWMSRMLPHGQSRPRVDAVELASPPYLSPNAILISTNFGFRAQDALAWNPREFHWFTTEQDRVAAERIFLAIRPGEPAGPANARTLVQLLAHAAVGTLTIKDAEFVGGSADQTLSAARVASHLESSAHTQVAGAASPLGTLVSIRFRVATVAPQTSTVTASKSTNR